MMGEWVGDFECEREGGGEGMDECVGDFGREMGRRYGNGCVGV